MFTQCLDANEPQMYYQFPVAAILWELSCNWCWIHFCVRTAIGSHWNDSRPLYRLLYDCIVVSCVWQDTLLKLQWSMTDGTVASNNVIHTPLLSRQWNCHLLHTCMQCCRFGAWEGLTEPLISSSYTELGCKYRLGISSCTADQCTMVHTCTIANYIRTTGISIAIMERKSRRRDGGHVAWYGIHIL